MQRDKSHDDQIERWANYVKNNSDWKMKLNSFINSQIDIARRAYKKLSETSEGRDKLVKIRELRVG